MDPLSFEGMREMMESLGASMGFFSRYDPCHCDRMRVLATNAQLISLAKDTDAIEAAAVFAGLTTCPELQSNLYRLGALVHAFIALSDGRDKPTPDTIREAFSSLEQTPVGMGEGPAEAVFISCVSSNQGSFRTFEGLWESNAFFLQRFLDILDGRPSSEWYSLLRKRVLTLLRLSDALASRCGLQRYAVGSEEPLDSIPSNLLGGISSLADRIRFSEQDLVRLQISPYDLAPFTLDLTTRHCLVGDTPSITLLERYPIVVANGCWYVMLPSAIGTAIRVFVVEQVSRANMMPQLEAQLAESYGKHFHSIRLLGDMGRLPVCFARNKRLNSFVEDLMVQIDEGRFVHFLFLLDNFAGAEDGWLLGRNANVMELGDEIDESIRSAVDLAGKSVGFKDGMTLIVHCGWGRCFDFAIPRERSGTWWVEVISAPDLTTLSLSPGFTALTLWRLLYARDKLTEVGGILQNINGLLNLYAWSKKLDHHLVPHEQIAFHDGVESLLICVDQSCLRELRHEACQAWDAHVRLSPEGRFVKVCKFFPSTYFAEDARIPLYGSMDDAGEHRLRAVYVGPRQDWWCGMTWPEESEFNVVDELFRAVVAWMHVLVPALEASLRAIPKQPLAWHLDFPSLTLRKSAPGIVRYDELKSFISISSDGRSTVNLTFDADFVRGFACEKNTAERSVIWGMVTGAFQACKQTTTESEIERVLDSVIVNEDAKGIHLFSATTCLDYVADTLPEPIVIEKSDDASLRIGLGWLGRSRDAGSRIVGINECTKYIGGLLDRIWDDVRKLLSGLDRIERRSCGDSF